MGDENKDRNSPLFRTLGFNQRSINEEDRTIEASISSEIEVVRWWGVEILGHESGDVRLDRIKNIGSLLFSHGRDVNYGKLPIGSIADVWLDQSQRKLRAKIKFDEDDESEKLWQKVKSGSLRGISIGYRVYAWTEVEQGSEFRGVKGPVSVATDWEPYEISLEPTPADGSVGVGRSNDDNGNKEPKNNSNERNGGKMGDENKNTNTNQSEGQRDNGEGQAQTTQTNSQEGTRSNPETDSESVRTQAVQAERQRVSEITSMCRNFDIDPAEHIEGGRSIDEVRGIILENLAQERQAVPTTTVQVDEKEKLRSAISDSLVQRSGITVEKPADGASDFRGFSLMELAREICERNNINVRGMRKLDIAERAIFGTGDFPAIMADVANKTMMKSYDEVPTTYQLWAKIVEASDFKQMHRIQLSEAPDLDEIGENGEYKHAKFSENEEKYALSTYGKKFSLSRKAIINDDLGALTRIPRLFGAAAARKANQLAYDILTSNPKMADGNNLFHASNHNNSLSSGTALSISSLAKARAMMRKQKGLAGKATLNISPKYLIVPAELETDAEQLISSLVDPTKANATPNPFANKLTPIVDAILDIDSTIAWYLLADHNQIDTVEVAFLNGNRQPVLESRQGWDVDGMEFKVRHDVAAKAIDWRGMFKNPGA